MQFPSRLIVTVSRLALSALAALIVGGAIVLAALAQSYDASNPPGGGGGWSSATFVAFLLITGAVVGGVVMFFLALRGGRRGAGFLSDDENQIFGATQIIAMTISAFAVIGVVILLWMCLGISAGKLTDFLAIFGADLIAGAAAGSVGAVAGFIFGIPRTREAADQVSTDGTALQERQKSKAVLLANTNLERISDWLTTLLIGATLVQLHDVPDWLAGLGKSLNTGVKNENVVPFVLVYFFGLAFLGIYLVTRLYLTATLRRTLDIVSGGDGVSEAAGPRRRLESALASGNADELLPAIQYVDNSTLKPDTTGDLGFSLALARTLLALLKAGRADDPAKRKQDLKTVVAVIATDATTKATLKDDLTNSRYSSGDSALDDELETALG